MVSCFLNNRAYVQWKIDKNLPHNGRFFRTTPKTFLVLTNRGLLDTLYETPAK